MKSKNLCSKEPKVAKRKKRNGKKKRRKSKKSKKNPFAPKIVNNVNNKYQAMIPKSFNDTDLRTSMHAGVFDMTDDSSRNGKTRQIMYCLVNFIYRNAFKRIIIPNKRMASYGLSKQTASDILKYYQKIGFLNKKSQGNTYSGMASEFRVNVYFLEKVYVFK